MQGDRCYLNFSSNDYLGLSHHPEIVRAWQQGAEQYGIGSGGSGHVTGYTDAHAALENQLADWLGYRVRCCLFQVMPRIRPWWPRWHRRKIGFCR